MKTLFALLILGVSGCASTQGTMFDGAVCTFATQDALAMSNLSDQIIESYVNEKDKERAKIYLATAKLTSTALCEMKRARDAAKG